MRPTTSKVLESLCSTLQADWEDARVLDLFAGSGSLGRAALEWGCREVTWVEGHPKVARSLAQEFPGRVVQGVLPESLSRLCGSFDIVLGDPPYGDPSGPATLAALRPLLAENAIVVFEHHHKDSYLDEYGFLSLYRRRRFGETALSYYRCVATSQDSNKPS